MFGNVAIGGPAVTQVFEVTNVGCSNYTVAQLCSTPGRWAEATRGTSCSTPPWCRQDGDPAHGQGQLSRLLPARGLGVRTARVVIVSNDLGVPASYFPLQGVGITRRWW